VNSKAVRAAMMFTVVVAGSLTTLSAPIAGACGPHGLHLDSCKGDTHITGVATNQTIDCSDGTLFVNGSDNVVTALGSCHAVTLQGSGNTVIADNVVNDITVFGFGQTVLYKNGNPAVIDRGRELGMTNRIDRVPA
jgi:Protein of unknown function (DUF3060)